MAFAAPPFRASFDGLLFDMDGTIIDSTNAVEKHWETIGDEIGVPASLILQTSHGRRSIDTLKILAPEKATWEYVREMEGRLPVLYGDEVTEVPGAKALLQEVMRTPATPWAIVTSGTLPLVTGWLDRLALPHPEHLVTAESVDNGKPDPACYLLGRSRLGLAGEGARVLVLEDSPAGIAAGKAAGCKVLAVVTTYTAEEVARAEPDWIVRDLRSVRLVEARDGVVTLELSNTLTEKRAPNGSA